MTAAWRLTRRAFLRGAGVTLALPAMESLPAWAEPGRAAPPLRLLVIFAGDGFHKTEWWARAEGRGMTFGKVLQPLIPLRHKLVFVRGLFNKEAQTDAVARGLFHPTQTGNLLSGAPLGYDHVIRSGTSFDQVLAQRIGNRTKLPSLVLGCEDAFPTVHAGISMAYSSYISWSSPTTPTPFELHPAAAFDLLFKDDPRAGDEKVLDSVLEDAKSLRTTLGQSDRHRLDAYLASIEDVERRIARAGSEGRKEGWRPTLDRPGPMARPPEGLPHDPAEHMRLMSDIVVLAFQTDTTRISTLKLINDQSSMRFPKLGIDGEGQHAVSHEDVSDRWLNINQFTVEQVAYLAGRLDQIQEGERTLLDNSMVLFLSSMLTGQHDSTQLPMVLLGSGGGRIRTGRILDYLGRPDPERAACNLYLSLMAKMGVSLDRFGDSDGPLVEI